MNKKSIILGLLFVVPILIFLVFATGITNFNTLDVDSAKLEDISSFKTIDGQPVSLKNKTTVLGFLGNDLSIRKINVYNLHEEIYKGLHSYDTDFQMVMLLPNNAKGKLDPILKELKRYTKINKWKFAYGTPDAIKAVFKSIKTPLQLDEHYGTDYVFIVDKDMRLRHSKTNKEIAKTKGYNATSIAMLHKEMDDDVTILLFEYKAATKSNYTVSRRDSFLKINQKKNSDEK